MSWIRIDDDFASHPKIASLTNHEFRVWLRVLCYCSRHRDPTVDKTTIGEVKGLRLSLVSRLFALSLLDQIGDDYEVHDWAKYQGRDVTGSHRQAKWRARRNDKSNASVTTNVTG